MFKESVELASYVYNKQIVPFYILKKLECLFLHFSLGDRVITILLNHVYFDY